MKHMLLRRITQHIKNQNWFAVFLDFMIVVVGVFIGIQVANWNQERATRAAEKQYLERLKADLENTSIRLEDSLDWQLANTERIQLVIKSLKNCELAAEDQDAFAVGLFVSGKLNPPILVDTTLEELKSSGQMNILSNKRLRSSLIELQRRFRGNSSHLDMINAWLVHPIKEINSRLIYLNLDENSANRNDIRWQDIEFDFAAACRDRVFRSAISAIWNYTFENARRARALNEATEEVIAELMGEPQSD